MPSPDPLKRAKYKEKWRKYKRSDFYKNNPLKYLVGVAKSRAKLYGIEFDISSSDIIMPSVCPITLEPITVLETKVRNSASLDRIDNSKGYVKGNVRVLSRAANRLKSNGTIQEFERIIKYMKGEI